MSVAAGHSALKTKYEAVDPEVIEFEENLHGPSSVAENELEKMDSASSAGTVDSVEEEMDGVAAEEKK